jgi:hypothetical protein
MAMMIIDFSPNNWFLAEENNAFYFEANCNHGVVGFTFLIQLSPDELTAYQLNGKPFLDALAQTIQDSAPIAANTTSNFKNRNVSSLLVAQFNAAVKRWEILNHS